MDLQPISPTLVPTGTPMRPAAGDGGTIFSPPTDGYAASTAGQPATYAAMPGLTAGENAQRNADRESDMRLLHSCGDGCGCASASGDDDPLRALEERDREVREHEQQHFMTAGDCAVGGPQYTLVTATNGRSYAIGGKVNVDVSEIPNDPRGTIEKMQRIWRAALAPANPSGQDRRVAADAMSKEAAAQQKLRENAQGGSQ